MGRGQKPAKSKEAKLPVARKSPKSDAARLRDIEKRLAEALKLKTEALQREEQAVKREAEAQAQQTATAEILRVIRSSPTNAQPVFDVIIRNAVRLCDGLFGCLFRFDGELLHLVAHHNFTTEALSLYERTYPVQAARDQLLGPIVLERRVMNVADVLQAVRNPLGQKLFGFRSGLGVPMHRDGTVIGAIAVSRTTVGLFPDTQIALLQTFADQAVIAIENVRLFKELEEKNRALTQAHAQVTESLEQQTATSEILRVISRSPTDVQPVFDTIVKNVVRLCDAVHSTVFRVDEGGIDLVAHLNVPPEGLEELRRRYPAPLSVNTGSAQAARERVVVQISDVENDPTVTEDRRRLAGIVGYRSQAWVPMLKGDRTLGVIGVSRREAEPFPAQHIALLQ